MSFEDRQFKMDRIVDEYKERENTQEDIAEKFKMSVRDIAKVTQTKNYHHTTKTTIENAKDDEKINPIISLDDMKFLDKYPKENFIHK